MIEITLSKIPNVHIRSKINCQKRTWQFSSRREFETLAEALEWARDLASRIVEGGFWTDEEIMMEHRSIDGVLTERK